MSYDKAHSMNGVRNVNMMSSPKSSAPPRSTLAGLLSSQRRAAQQNDRYRVQSARPFADSSQVDQAVVKRKEENTPQQPSRQSRWGSKHNSHQTSSSCKDSRQGSDSSSSTSPRRSATQPCQYNNMHKSATQSDTTTAPSRRVVRFSPPTTSDSTQPIKSPEEKIPRKKKRSRWDVRPRIELPPSSDPAAESTTPSHADVSIQNRQQQSGEPKKSTSPSKSILRKKEERLSSSAAISSEEQNASLPKSSNSPPRGDNTEKRREGQTATETNNSETTAYHPKESTALKGSYSKDSATEISHASGGDLHLSSSSRREEMNASHTTMPAAPKTTNAEMKESYIIQSKSEGDVSKDRVVEPKESMGENMQRTGDDSEKKKKIPDNISESKPVHSSPLSKTEEAQSCLSDKEARERAAAKVGDSPRSEKQDSNTRPTLGGIKEKRRDSEANNAKVKSKRRWGAKRDDVDASQKSSNIDRNGVGELPKQDSMKSQQCGESSVVPNNEEDSPYQEVTRKKKKKKKHKEKRVVDEHNSSTSGELLKEDYEDSPYQEVAKKKRKKKRKPEEDASVSSNAEETIPQNQPVLTSLKKSSKIGPNGGEVLKQDSMKPQQQREESLSVPNEDSSCQVTKKKKKKKREKVEGGVSANNAEPEQRVLNPKPEELKQEDASKTSRSIVDAKKKKQQDDWSKPSPKSKRKGADAAESSPKSKFKQDLIPKEEKSSDLKDDTLGSKKDSSAGESTLVVEQKPNAEGVISNNRKEVMPSKSKPKREEDALAAPCSGAVSPKKKRKKDFSPFRVKVGCVVAVRFRKLGEGGNSAIVPVVKDGDTFRAVIESSIESTDVLKQSGKNGNATDQSEGANDENKNGHADASKAATVAESASNEGNESGGANCIVKQLDKDKNATKRTSKHYEVWSSPIPGRDDGLSLLGSWIRCAFPKSFVLKWQKSNEKGMESSSGRIVEGNVISILGNSDGSQGGINVCLLVDRSSMKSLPYLQVMPDDSNDPTLSSSQQKRRKTEAKIRGEDKVVVRVTLASIFDQRNGTKLDPGVVSQWVVRKRISAKPAGKKPTKKERKQNKQRASSLFVGDGNDTQSQQENNWRWIASRGSDTGDSVLGNNMQDSVSQLVGEVVKINVSPTQDGSVSLATVTIKRLWTPEQVKGGRLAHHRPLELFYSSQDDSNERYFQAPIENLIVVGKHVTRLVDVWKQPNLDSAVGGDDPGWSFSVTHSYQTGDNTYWPLCEDAVPKESLKTCHYCQRLCHDSQLRKCQHENVSDETWWCVQCLQLVGVSPSCDDSKTWQGPCCTGKCDCSVCPSSACEASKPNASIVSIQNGIGRDFSGLVACLQSSPPMDFTLPSEIEQLSLRPSLLPNTGNKKSKSYSKALLEEEAKDVKQGKKKRANSDTRKKTTPRKKRKVKIDVDVPEEEEDQALQAGSSRAVSFDQLNKRCWGFSKQKIASDVTKQPIFRQNARARVIKIGKTVENTTLSGRAARANQRRMFKSLTSLGDATVDRLAGRDREQQLRFDKSQIHGWGVYAEEPINAGDMIIEYRGEIIGNAVADKRELEYEKAKLDDYMFRIDAYTVCDATMLGNVARYINASCTPNCYTQIITAGEDKNKRIVIYAKKDIQRGEELSYDYKFSLEYDSTKRIPCHCGTSECHGFMNWDKKYL